MACISMSNRAGESPQGLTCAKRDIDNQGELGLGEGISSREEHTNGLFTAKCSSLKTYMQVTICKLSRLNDLGIYMYMRTHLYVITINEKKKPYV